MLYRLLIASTIFFWILMNGALVRLWIDPSGRRPLSIPAAHVAQQAFINEKSSNLDVFQNGKKIGYLHLTPRHLDSGQYHLAFKTNLLLELPFMPQQPYSIEGHTRLKADFTPLQIKATIDIPLPKVGIEMDLDLQKKVAHCLVQQNIAPAVETRLPLNQYGLNQILDSLGIDPTVIQQITVSTRHAAGSNTSLSLSAQKAPLQTKEGTTDGYHLILRQSTSPIVEADVTLLGEIVSLKSVFGIQMERQD